MERGFSRRGHLRSSPGLEYTRGAFMAAVFARSEMGPIKVDCPGSLENGAGARLFVYGTLRKGFRAHGLLLRFRPRPLGAGHVPGRLYELGDYPGAAEAVGNEDRIQGELYWLPRAEVAFKVLDNFEGFDPARPASNEFERKETMVTLAGGRRIRAWIYRLAPTQARGRRILSGNYALRRK
jgi:gamma-glutamylcyclotransferase (GGCT)/AIG2-like uncharacterized protein YtfP